MGGNRGRIVAGMSVWTASLLLAACGSGGDGAANGPPRPKILPGVVTVEVSGMTGDGARGQRLYARCAACHSVDPGRNGIGPSLYGVVGREAGSVPGYSYSSVNKNSHKIWNEPTLFQYLESPPMMLPGTKMAFVMTDPQDRADVIAYLTTLRDAPAAQPANPAPAAK